MEVTRTLTVEVTFDSEKTEISDLAGALNLLLDTALSTQGVLDEHGPVGLGEFREQTLGLYEVVKKYSKRTSDAVRIVEGVLRSDQPWEEVLRAMVAREIKSTDPRITWQPDRRDYDGWDYVDYSFNLAVLAEQEDA